MRIRENNPFFGITEEQKEMFLEEAEELCHSRLAELWEMRSGKHTTEGQVKRFLQRLRYERAVRDLDDSPEDTAEFAKRARDGKARDGLIEAARQKLFEEALANGDQALLLELYKAASDERAREREAIVAQRKAAVAEENAMIGWAKVPGGRPASVKILKADVTASEPVIEGSETRLLEGPKLRELLADTAKSPEERIAAALECLAMDSGVGMIDERAKGELGGPTSGPGPIQKAGPNIDWDAPMKEAAGMFQRLTREADARAKALEKGT